LIKCVKYSLASPLTNIINNCIDNLVFPDQWKVARICPIPKTDYPQTTADYRPISVLPVLSKVYEKVILQQMTKFIENELVYHTYQSGFRKNHSTVTLLIKLRDDIKKEMKKGEVTIAVFADYSKAFDTIDFYTLI